MALTLLLASGGSAPAVIAPPAPVPAPLVAPARRVGPGGKRLGLELGLLGAVVLLALALRLTNLGGFPDTVLADEADNAQMALRILYGLPPANGFFGFDWKPQPAFSVYLLSGSLQFFGPTITALRLPSALLSVLALLPFYVLLRRQFAVLTAFLVTFLLATNVWYLHFSRSGWENVHVACYMLGAMLFLVLGLDGLARPLRAWRTWLAFAAAGVFCALGLYGYFAGRAIVVVVIAFLPFALGFYRRYWPRLLLGYSVLGLVTALLFLPQATYILANWEWFNGRSGNVLLFNNPEYQADPPGMFWAQVVKNVRAPWDGQVNNATQYTPGGEPFLDPATGLLALAGLGLSVLVGRLRRRPETWLWGLMLLLSWAFTELITVNTPNGARGVGWMPTLLYFAAIPLDELLRLARRLPARRAWQTARWTALAALAGVLLLAGYTNATHYFAWQSSQGARHARYIYLTAQEFPAWVNDVVDRARQQQGGSNLGEWRTTHPLNYEP